MVLENSAWILEEERTHFGRDVPHGFWEARDGRSALLGGGCGVGAGSRKRVGGLVVVAVAYIGEALFAFHIDQTR
jgi:hypothetical protein